MLTQNLLCIFILTQANWLIGLFEPEKDIAFMDNWPEKPVRQSGQDATIDSTIVTKTNNLELLTMYKLIRREFCTLLLLSCFGSPLPILSMLIPLNTHNDHCRFL